MADIVINNDIELRILAIFQLLFDCGGGPIHPICTRFFDLIPFMMRQAVAKRILLGFFVLFISLSARR